VFGSVFRSKSAIMVVCELAGAFSEVHVVHVSTPLICCSMGVGTDCSGSARSGRQRRPAAESPAERCSETVLRAGCDGDRAHNHHKDAITIATIGRLMKNFDIDQFPSPESCAGLGVTTVPSLSLCVPSTTTCSLGFRPLSITHIVPTVCRASRCA